MDTHTGLKGVSGSKAHHREQFHERRGETMYPRAAKWASSWRGRKGGGGCTLTCILNRHPYARICFTHTHTPSAEFTDAWFYREDVNRFRADLSRFATSSLRRMMDTLPLFGKTLDDLEAPALVGDGHVDPKTLWKGHVRLVAWKKGFLALVRRKIASYPAWKHGHYRRVCFPPGTEPGLSFPSYVCLGGPSCHWSSLQT